MFQTFVVRYTDELTNTQHRRSVAVPCGVIVRESVRESTHSQPVRPQTRPQSADPAPAFPPRSIPPPPPTCDGAKYVAYLSSGIVYVGAERLVYLGPGIVYVHSPELYWQFSSAYET
eukprot:4269024-Amphidinium_carterae.2